MLVHIGADIAVRSADIVGIFDLDGSVTTAATADFLKRCDASGESSLAGDDLPRAFVLISPKRGGERVIYSRISSKRLGGRGRDLLSL